MGILIDKVRIKNFRSLENVEVNLEPITVLVGANNAGKTTFLKALNTVLGINKTQFTKEDLFINSEGISPNDKTITIDIHIIPIDKNTKERVSSFENDWSSIFPQVFLDTDERDFFAFRSQYIFTNEGDAYHSKNYVLQTWDMNTTDSDGSASTEWRKNIKLHFLDAQRDLNDDTKLRSSFFGKLATQIENDYSKDDINTLEALIKELNNKAIEKSEVLKNLSEALSVLNKTIRTNGEGVSISPFSKKIRDLHKGMKVNFQDNGSDSFSLEYHGMGTRSWASIITFGAYVDWTLKQIDKKIENGDKDAEIMFPILALEEPEAHLHPNAQRTLYSQLKNFEGQKIVSTHSPYIAGQAELKELRHFYKNEDKCQITQLLFRDEEDNEITRLQNEIEEQGKIPEICSLNYPKINQLKGQAIGKLSKEFVDKIRREIMLSRGELLFAKAVILFEGITEELALPIYAKKYFNDAYPYELGITFLDVGGKQGYLTFLLLIKFLKIPCFILSDGDGNTKNEVEKQIDNANCDILPNLYVLDSYDFEQYLVEQGFEAEINKAIDIIEKQENYIIDKYIPQLNGQKKKGGGMRNYDENGQKNALLDYLSENKTKIAEECARQILLKEDENSNPSIPPKIKDLFDKIKSELKLENNDTTETI